MLIQCGECQREISDQAAACPHCGAPVKAPLPIDVEDEPFQPAKKATPIFVWLALVSLIVGLDTPRLLILFPVLGVLCFSIISIARNEKGRGWSWLFLVLGIGLYSLSGFDGRPIKAKDAQAEKSVRLVSERWVKKPDFASRGAIEWVVEVQNISDRNMRSVEIEFTTYDAAGKVVSTDSGYAQAISPANTATAKGYADYYRTEAAASFRVKRVNFAD